MTTSSDDQHDPEFAKAAQEAAKFDPSLLHKQGVEVHGLDRERIAELLSDSHDGPSKLSDQVKEQLGITLSKEDQASEWGPAASDERPIEYPDSPSI